MHVKKVVQLDKFREAKKARTEIERLKEDLKKYPRIKEDIQKLLDLLQRQEAWREGMYTTDHPDNPFLKEILQQQHMSGHIQCQEDFIKSLVNEQRECVKRCKKVLKEIEAHAHTS